MLIDITLRVTPQMILSARENLHKVMVGHLGTHFDVMDKEFPLEYSERQGLVFDVSHISERDIEIYDIELERVQEKMFVAFYSGFIEKEGYGGKRYFTQHPQLAHDLIDQLIAKGISMIGVDFAGIRRGAEHTPKDRQCAENGVFVIENLCNLQALVAAGGEFTVCTYPLNFADMSGLPCRVIARVR